MTQEKPLEVCIDLPDVIEIVVNPFMQEVPNGNTPDPWMDTAPV
jgi:hypothetical protein